MMDATEHNPADHFCQATVDESAGHSEDHNTGVSTGFLADEHQCSPRLVDLADERAELAILDHDCPRAVGRNRGEGQQRGTHHHSLLVTIWGLLIVPSCGNYTITKMLTQY